MRTNCGIKYIFFILGLTFYHNVSSLQKLTILADYVTEGNGPFEVYNNLIKGLRILRIPFNVNPLDEDVGDTVLVLSGVHNLVKAVAWKRVKKIRYLLGGPNIMNRPNESDYLFASKEVDRCLVPAYWIQVAYEEDAPTLIGRIRCWFTGIDTNEWIPRASLRDKVLIYWKTEDKLFYNQVEALVRKYHYNPICIRYGSYRKSDYKHELNRAKFAIFITRSESQGIALAEAWSMDVPTLVFDPQTLTYQGKCYSLVSSCPYLTPYTGNTWKTLQELELLIKDNETTTTYSSRAWVTKHMTLEASVVQLMDIIKEVEHA